MTAKSALTRFAKGAAGARSFTDRVIAERKAAADAGDPGMARGLSATARVSLAR